MIQHFYVPLSHRCVSTTVPLETKLFICLSITSDKYSPNYGVRPKEQQRNCQVLDLPLISCFKEEVWAGVACLVVTAVLVAIVVFVVSAFAVEPVTIAGVAFVIVVVIAVSVVDMLGDVGFNAVVILVDTAALDIDVVVST